MDEYYNFEVNSCFNSYNNYTLLEKPESFEVSSVNSEEVGLDTSGGGSSKLNPPFALNLFKTPFL